MLVRFGLFGFTFHHFQSVPLTRRLGILFPQMAASAFLFWAILNLLYNRECALVLQSH